MQLVAPHRQPYYSVTVYQIATGVGLVSLTFFFGALILAFGFRIEQQRSWERFTFPSLLWLSTGILLLSSWTLEGARRALKRAHVAIYRGRLAATLAFALLFLGAQSVSAIDLLRQGVATAGNPHGSAFYVFMAVHGAHLFGGFVWLTGLRIRARRLFRGTETDLRRHRRVASAAAMYWHFMGALWIVLFVCLRRWTSA